MNTSKVLRTIIMGAPGSGKGTISERLVKNFNFVHVSCGDILRKNIDDKTQLGNEASKFITKGELVPDELVINCILDKLKPISNKPWMLDGFPRTLIQAKKLDEFQPIDVVLCLQVPHEVIIERLQNRWIHAPSGRIYNIGFNDPKVPFKDDLTGESLTQRNDDKPETVKNRLNIYESQTTPVADFYRKQKKLVSFSGKTTAEIWPQVQEFVKKQFGGST